MAELPQNAVALYRIMSEKSYLGFGKYGDLPVGDILKIDPEYIVWVYACKEKCSFSKEILEKLGVREVKKPGIDPGALYEWKDKQEEGFTEEQIMHGRMIRNKGKKAQARANLIRVEKYNRVTGTKGALQAVNHGHRKLK